MPKPTLRQHMRAITLETKKNQGQDFDARIADLFHKSQHIMPGSVIAGYAPFGSEVNCTPILQQLVATGQRTCLPVVVQRDEPMIFRVWRPGDKTIRGQLGQSEPMPHMPEVFPDVLIIPMLGFTRSRHRLGYGSGFYDRTLAALMAIKSVKTVGLAYSIQEVSTMAPDAHDVPLDVIITETEIIKAP